MEIRVAAAVRVRRPLEEVYDFAVAEASFPRIVHALGPIPGIARVEMLDGRVLERGARRRVTMTDGSEVLEEILDAERPRRHRYRWLDPPAAPFNLLVRSGEGDWRFAAADGGTRVEWTYTFDLTTPLVYPLAAAVLTLFRRWMQRALDRIDTAIAR
jgi:uncharacterized protein YndB with AHSA1/START domain